MDARVLGSLPGAVTAGELHSRARVLGSLPGAVTAGELPSRARVLGSLPGAVTAGELPSRARVLGSLPGAEAIETVEDFGSTIRGEEIGEGDTRGWYAGAVRGLVYVPVFSRLEPASVLLLFSGLPASPCAVGLLTLRCPAAERRGPRARRRADRTSA